MLTTAPARRATRVRLPTGRLTIALAALAIVTACADPVTEPPSTPLALAARAGGRTITTSVLTDPGAGAAVAPDGRIAGYVLLQDGDIRHAAVWDDGALTDLGTVVGGSNSGATGINARGQVVGWSTTTPPGPTVAVLWQDQVMTVLPSLGGRWSSAEGINAAGDIVGASMLPDNESSHAVLWHDGQLIDLGTLGGTFSYAYAINPRGQVVGYSTTAAGWSHAFLWEDGGMTDLGTFGGPYPASVARDINARGQVVGCSVEPNGGTMHAVLWEDGKMTDLSAPDGDWSCAYAINSRGQVVGSATSTTHPGWDHAFFWDNGVMTDLGAPGGRNSVANDISESGSIIGTAPTFMFMFEPPIFPFPVIWKVR